MPTRSALAPHYESEIRFVESDADGAWVEKRYRSDSDCVSWLNERLAEWYDPRQGQPVAQHEWAAYQLLSPFGIVPRPIRRDADAIVIDFGGDPLHARSKISRSEYRSQAESILKIFDSVGFRHNDLLARNVLVDAGRLRIIDFTLAEFGDVDLMSDLPDPNWARPGHDDDLLHFLRDLRRQRWLGPLARL